MQILYCVIDFLETEVSKAKSVGYLISLSFLLSSQCQSLIDKAINYHLLEELEKIITYNHFID